MVNNNPNSDEGSLAKLSDAALIGLLQKQIPADIGLANRSVPLPSVPFPQKPTETSGDVSETPASHTPALESDSDVSLLLGQLDPPQQPDELARIQGYRILKVLGIGGMGIVFQAEDLKLRRQVAIKLIRPKQLKNRQAAERFIIEAQAAARLNHDHIVTVYHVGQHGDIPYLVMQLLSGESLASRLRSESKLDVITALNIARQVALGLAAAHGEGILHRDIKPDNIWLDATTNRVKILDFGLAQLRLPDMETTDDNILAGTPNYIAPERIRGEVGDQRSDLYSLGIVIYEMLAGHRPFQATGITRTLHLGANYDPEPLPSLLPAPLDSQTRFLVEKLIEKDPQSRTNDAKELIVLIDSILLSAAPALKSVVERRMNWRWTLALCLTAVVAIAVYMITGRWSVSGAVLFAATPDSIASLDDLDFTILELNTGENYAVRLGESKLKPGSYRIEPSAVEGVKFSMDRFEVVAGSIQSVDVSYEPNLNSGYIAPETSRLIDPTRQWSGLTAWTLETRLHRGRVLAMDTSFDGRWLATGGDDAIVRIWSTSDMSLATILIGQDYSVIHVQWSPTDSRLITATRQKLTLWDASLRRKIIESPTATDGIRRVRWSPDGSKILVADGRSALTIYSAQNLEEIESHRDNYVDAHWRDNSQAVLVVRQDGTFQERLLDSWQLRSPTKLKVNPNARNAVTGGGRICASFTNASLSVADIDTGQVLPPPTFDPLEIQDIWAVMGGEQFMAEVRNAEQTSLKLWDGRTGAVLQEWKYPTKTLGYLLISWNSDVKKGFVFVPSLVADFDFLRLGSQSIKPVTYRVSYGVEAGTSNIIRRIDDFDYSRDGKRLAIAHGSLDIWDVESGKFIRECRGFRHDARFIRWVADDSRVAVDTAANDADDLNIYLVDPNRDGEQLLYADADRPEGEHFASRIMSNDGGWFLGSNGPKMTVISTTNSGVRRQLTVSLAGQEAIVARSISNQGKIAIAINQGVQRNSCVRVCDSVDHAKNFDIILPEPAEELYWSPDGVLLVAIGISGRANAFSAINGANQNLIPLRQPIRGLSWSPDSSRLAVITQSNIGIVWDLKTNRKLCSFAAAAVERPTVKWHPSGELISYINIWGEVVTIAADSGRTACVMFALSPTQMYWIRADETISSRDGKTRFDDDVVISVWDPDGTQSTIHRVAFCPDNRHYYEFVPANRINWKTAKEQAAGRVLVDSSGIDRKGYLATITTHQEQAFLEKSFGLLRMVWVGGTDEAEEGQWRWVTGPESLEDGERGRLFWTGLSAANGGLGTVLNVPNNLNEPAFSNWIPPDGDFLGEPNNLFDEDYLIWNHNAQAMGVRGRVGLWNDQMNHSPRKGDSVTGYLVEYGD